MIVTRQVLTIFIGHEYLYERGVLHRDISPEVMKKVQNTSYEVPLNRDTI